MTLQVPIELATKLASAWNAGHTISDLQSGFGLSRQTVSTALRLERIDPRSWRERNRAIGKPIGPCSELKNKLEDAPGLYSQGASLASLAQKYNASRSSIRRVLKDASVPLRPRGRPVKGLPRI